MRRQTFCVVFCWGVVWGFPHQAFTLQLPVPLLVFLRRQEMLYVGVGFELDKKSLGLVVLLAWNAAKGLIFFLPSLTLWKLPPPINLPRMPCTDLRDVVYFFCGRFLVLFLSKSGRKARCFLIG